MKLFPALRAVATLSRQLKSLEQTIIARSLLQFPETKGMNMDSMYQRRDIISPLLKEVYDSWQFGRIGVVDKDLGIVDSIGNWEIEQCRANNRGRL